MKSSWAALTAIGLLAIACTEQTSQTQTSPDILRETPEGVVAIAAPYQDLTVVRINPDDGCYEYHHAGPVETTFLPLRTSAGNPICSRAPGT